MTEKIVIIGGGQASISCASHLRTIGFDGEIFMICEENLYPYQRPPLSKRFLTGHMLEERLLLKKTDYYKTNNIEVIFSVATKIDREKKEIYLQSGEKIVYTKLVIATGSRAKKAPLSDADDYSNVAYLRNLNDAKSLKNLLQPGKKILIVGGGYLGLEVASVCSLAGMDTIVVEGADRILNRVAGEPTATYLKNIFSIKGVKIIENEIVKKINCLENNVTNVELVSGKTIDLDFLLVATGGYPEVALAKKANLQIENGIKVNKRLETNDSSIYAAGDCASFYHNGELLRLESVGNAIDQGQTVALNIIGSKTNFKAKPWFWTEQFDKKLQIAGLCNGFTEIIARKVKDKASFWYFKNEMLIAVDAFNDPHSYMIARRLIEENKSPKKEIVRDINFEIRNALNTK
ncbi:FAD-dependent oxidoreductase [Paracoccaceae bacterium]|nr:FAD-dependent oxidoreductase [Paracoccaceae bacterium]